MRAQQKDNPRRRLAQRPVAVWSVASLAPLLLCLLVACGPTPPEDIASPPLASRDDLKPTIEGYLDITQDLEKFLPELGPPKGNGEDVGGREVKIDGPSSATVTNVDKGDNGGETNLVAKPELNGNGGAPDVDLTKAQRAPKREARRQVVELPPIFFEYNSYRLSELGPVQLEQCARHLKRNPELQVLIEGHTDERGTTEYNYNLGAQRAAQVREFLIKRGINPARLFLVSYGEERPADPAATPEAWEKNRRVEFFVY